jgi:hypothetical protein
MQQEPDHANLLPKGNTTRQAEGSLKTYRKIINKEKNK